MLPADFLLTTVCCIVPSRLRMMQCHYRTTFTLYSSGRKTGLILKNVKSSESQTKKKIIDAKYTIHGQVLHETNRAKYVGVSIDNTLSWNSHIDIMTKKANNTTAFLRRNLSSCPADVKSASDVFNQIVLSCTCKFL